MGRWDYLVDRTRLAPSFGAPMATGLGRARALGALASIGAPSVGLKRADSVTNEVWMTPELVVRVNRDSSLRLHREAVLSQVLPTRWGIRGWSSTAARSAAIGWWSTGFPASR